MKTDLHNKPNSGFTLIEMTVTIVVGLMVATMALTMFNQQLASYKILKAQNFLISEAPQINNTLNRIVTRANFFRMYESLADATAGNNSVIENGKVLALKFEDAGDQSGSSFGVIAFNSSTNHLNYYHVSSMAGLAVASPQWSISTQLTDAVFYVENGVLRIKLTGPNAEEIIYSTTTQR
ncbi:MAG: prepilin-type N-terminal cleavage/methylation domain-containing protein [Akkermansiaceae bacterium]|nr:prepilin-type N-terminal cleavage/methylation domain-containing protein [Akkermansiaceae bacterium]